MSRPSLSVPSQWWPTGPLRMCAKSVSRRAVGPPPLVRQRRDHKQQEVDERDDRGLLAQETAERASSGGGEVPAHDLDRAADPGASASNAGAWPGLGRVDRLGIELVVRSRHAHPRIEVAVADVDDQVDDHVDEDEHDRDALDHRDVVVVDGGKEVRCRGRGSRTCRSITTVPPSKTESWSPSTVTAGIAAFFSAVLADDARAAAALGPRRAHVVRVERVDQGRANLAGQRRGGPRRPSARAGSTTCSSQLRGIVFELHPPDGGEPSEVDGEDDDEEHREPEVRDRDPQARGADAELVADAARFRARQDPEREPDQDADR